MAGPSACLAALRTSVDSGRVKAPSQLLCSECWSALRANVPNRARSRFSASRRLRQILVRVNIAPQVAQVQVAVAFAMI